MQQDNNIKTLTPLWNDNYVAIAMSSSSEYVPYLSVCIQSVIENLKPEHNYDIIIFERNITGKDKSILYQQTNEYKNLSLRFINPMKIISNYNLQYHSNYNLECFFRLSAPIILKNYSKIIYTDIDLIFNADIYELYSIDLGEYPIAACKDLMWQAFINTPFADWTEYGTNTLKLNDLHQYFNTGVMLINIEKFNKNNYSSVILDMLEKTQYRILEQDALNSFFQSNIKYIDTKWNVPIVNKIYNKIIEYMPSDAYIQYCNDREAPKIIHYAGKGKAWNNPNEDLAHLWWKYARKSPYYEVIIFRLMHRVINSQNKNALDNIHYAFEYRTNVLKYWKYKILAKLLIGKKKEHYITKKNIWKQKIRIGEKIRGIKQG